MCIQKMAIKIWIFADSEARFGQVQYPYIGLLFPYMLYFMFHKALSASSAWCVQEYFAVFSQVGSSCPILQKEIGCAWNGRTT
jgi:hypothetical protein